MEDIKEVSLFEKIRERLFDKKYNIQIEDRFLTTDKGQSVLLRSTTSFCNGRSAEIEIFAYLQDKYSENIDGDISLLDVEYFLQKMQSVAKESYRVLKRNKHCAFMIGDIRKHSRVVPLGFQTMECFLKAGFCNKEIIIKEQHNCRSTDYWKTRSRDFLLLAHEYIFVLQKCI